MGITQKIGVCLPTNRGVKAKTLQSLLEMIAATPNCEIFVSEGGFNTAENRTWLAAQAIKGGCTHILWVDDDMIYEKDTIKKLLKTNKDFIGAKYANRRGEGDVIEYLDLKDAEKKDKKPFEVRAIGGGCTLMNTEAMKTVPIPWFWYQIAQTGAVLMSHDWFFCMQAREAGHKIWCHPDVHPGHITEKQF